MTKPAAFRRWLFSATVGICELGWPPQRSPPARAGGRPCEGAPCRPVPAPAAVAFTDRVIAKRIKVAREVVGFELADIVPGRLDDEQYYLGCRRLCHPEKNLPNANRQRDDLTWRRLERVDS